MIRHLVGCCLLIVATALPTASSDAQEPDKNKIYRVVGVPFTKWLTVRQNPRDNAIIEDILPANTTGLRITGEERRTKDGARWVKVNFKYLQDYARISGNRREIEIVERHIKGWVEFHHLKPYDVPVPVLVKKSQYTGGLIVEPLEDGNLFRLEKDFGYTDATGLHWRVPKGTVVDGASIPRALWSIVGSPFTGKYRHASVIHDYYCATKERPWRSTHRVFHEAMLKSGVNSTLAYTMFYAVYKFGPRWTAAGIECYHGCAGDGDVIISMQALFDMPTFEKMRKRIMTGKLSIDDIEREVDAEFRQPTTKLKGVWTGTNIIQEGINTIKLDRDILRIKTSSDLLPNSKKEFGLPGYQLVIPGDESDKHQK